ncbi:helix-turn-helix transcriptional regulator [Enterococcus faecium]|nr:helix-turn-helix transcriptional regulator [Enterococcus faecium]
MEIHKLLRKLRVERGLSQKELSKGIITRETFVKYENGKTNIPFFVLIELLEKMNLSLDEFIFYLDKDILREKNWSLKKLIKKIREDKSISQHMLQALRKKARNTNNIVDIRNYLVAKTIGWYQLADSERKLNNSDKEYLYELKNYLEAVDDWGRFEMATFTTLLFVFETNYINGRLSDIERKIEKNKDFEIFHSILIGMYNNAFLLMLERKETVLAKKYLEKIADVRHRLLFFGDTGVYCNFYKITFRSFNRRIWTSK